MSRQTKGKGKSAPGLRDVPLTESQFHLLVWVYIRGYRENADSHITWSPKAFLGRAPTKAEAAALSRRAKGLEKRGLLYRHGRELSISDIGKQELALYALEHNENSMFDHLLAHLNFETAAFELGFFNSLRPTLTAVYCNELGLEQNDAADAAAKLHAALIRHGIKQARKALEKLQDSQRQADESET